MGLAVTVDAADAVGIRLNPLSLTLARIVRTFRPGPRAANHPRPLIKNRLDTERNYALQ
jgi:hypothetical protein